MEDYLKIKRYFQNIKDIPNLYIWKIINSQNPNSFTIFKNGIVFLQLELVKTAPYLPSHEVYSQDTQTSEVEESNFTFDNKKRIEVVTNENLEDMNDNFYLFSFNENPYRIEDLFILGNDSQKTHIPESEKHQAFSAWIITLDELKTLSSLDPTLIKIIIGQEKISSVNEINIKLENAIFLQNITVTGDLENKGTGEVIANQNFDLENVNNEIEFIPQFVNPTTINNDITNFYLSSLNQNFQLDITSLLKELGDDLKLNVKNYLNDDDAYELIKNCIKVSQTVSSSYSGLSKESIEKFKKDYFNGNDPQQYCDFKIQDFMTKKSDNQELINKTLAVILALSFQIKSSYCWRGGFTEEHKLGLTFYLYASYGQFYLKSHYLNIKKEGNKLNLSNQTWGFLNGNTFILGNKTITLPSLSKSLEAQNLSNTPLDFNEKSFNLNYLVWTPIPKGKISDYFLKDFKEEETVQKYELEMEKSIADYVAYRKNPKFWEDDLREKLNIPANSTLQANSLEIIDVTEKWTFRQPQIPSRGVVEWFHWGYKFKVRGYFVVRDVIINSQNEPIIKNNLDYRRLLQSKNLFQMTELKLKLKQKLIDENWQIKNISKILISHIMGSNLVLEIANENNKKYSFETKMMNQINPLLSQTIIYLNT